MNASFVSFCGVCALALACAEFAVGALMLAAFAATKRLTPSRTRLLVWWLSIAFVQGAVGFVAVVRADVFERFTRSRDLAVVDEHAKELVGAIQRFEQARGRAPKRLRELVPDFLPSIPATGLRSWPKYEYSAGARASNGDWGLVVWIPQFFVDFDGNRRFEYRPQAAADAKPGMPLRHGDWVYEPD